MLNKIIHKILVLEILFEHHPMTNLPLKCGRRLFHEIEKEILKLDYLTKK